MATLTIVATGDAKPWHGDTHDRRDALRQTCGVRSG
jgi:hypothetical protein